MSPKKFATLAWETAGDDIYNSKEKYKRIRENLERFLLPPRKFCFGVPKNWGVLSSIRVRGNRKYYIKNIKNIKHVRKLLAHKDAQGTSYKRRIRLFQTLLLFLDAIGDIELDKLVADSDRDTVNAAISFMRQRYCSSEQGKYVLDLKHIAKIIVPENDEKGRPDETVVPYTFRHLSSKVDKSKQTERKDKLDFEEVQRIIQYFRQDIRMQAYCALEYESVARPQELLYLRIKDVTLLDNCAQIQISEHGKEGTGLLQCFDSFMYVSRWLNEHPLRHDPDAFLFCNIGDTNRHGQLKIHTVNKHLKNARLALKIDKPVTAYSLKRNGISHRRLKGESDMDIQHAARWSSTKQLKVYDNTDQQDAFMVQQIKRGLIKPGEVPEKLKRYLPESRKCMFCEAHNGIVESICHSCKRPLDRKDIMKKENEMRDEMDGLKSQMDFVLEACKVALKDPATARRNISNMIMVEEKLKGDEWAKKKQ